MKLRGSEVCVKQDHFTHGSCSTPGSTIDMASASLLAHGFRYDFDCVDPNLVSQPNATPALPIAWQNVPREQSDSRRWFRALYEWDARLRVVRRRLQERSFDDIPGNESR